MGGSKTVGFGGRFSSALCFIAALAMVQCSKSHRDLPGPPAAARTDADRRVIEGTVTSVAGEVVSGATVHARRLKSTAATGETVRGVTDERGTYRLTVVPSSEYVVEASAPHFAVGSVYVPQGRLTTVAADIVLVPAAAIHGRVVDGDSGRGVAGARVTLTGELPVGSVVGALSQSAESDAAGAFSFEALRPGRLRLAATIGSRTSSVSTFATVLLGGRVDGMTLPIHPAGSVEGSIVARGGSQPVAGVWVDARDDATGEAHVAEQASDATGHFSVIGLRPGIYVFDAFRDGDLPTEVGSTIAVGSGVVRDLVLSFDDSRRRSRRAATATLPKPVGGISGRILGLGDLPLAGAGVALTGAVATREELRDLEKGGWEKSEFPFGVYQRREYANAFVYTDSTGTFEASALRPGLYDIHVYDGSHRLSWVDGEHGYPNDPITVRVEGSPADRGDIAVRGCAGAIKATIVDSAGNSLADVAVTASPDSADTNSGWLDPADIHTAVTDKQGTVSLGGLCETSYRVSAFALASPGQGAISGIHPGPGPLRLELQSPSPLAVRVTYRGERVQDFALSLDGAATVHERVHSEDGTFLYPTLTAGRYRVLVTAEQGFALRSIDVPSPSARELLVALYGWSSLRGRVVSSRLDPRFVTVKLSLGPTGGQILRAATDANGVFAFPRLPGGKVQLSFGSPQTIATVSQAVPATPGEPGDTTASARDRRARALSFELRASQSLDVGDIEMFGD